LDDYLVPLDRGFFRRGAAPRASVVDHLRHVFRTPRGSFPADPEYGSALDLFRLGAPADAQQLVRLIEETIERADPRVLAARASVLSRDADRVSIAVELEILNPPRPGPVDLLASIHVREGRVEVEEAP
jgi:predicted component of type VI protein secretion system